MNIHQRIELVEAALGYLPFDAVIDNVKVVNVYTGNILDGAIGIKNGRVVTFRAPKNAESMQYMDGKGKYAIPGLIDTHVHIDSTLLTPHGMAELVVPHGTTAVFADPMEISNVAGYAGMEALLLGSEQLSFHIYLEVSSRVPTAPGLETTGGELRLEEVRRILRWKEAVSLGELDPSKILGLHPEYFAKVEAALGLGKIANGHAIGLSGERLIAYACGGLMDDHECVTFEEAITRNELGMAVLVREGSTERNLETLIRGAVAHKIDTRHWMMCTDDKHPNEMLSEGHIDYMVNKAISLGMSPIQAIQMATLNAAAHFRLDHELGSIAPGRWADIILTESLQSIQPVQVFFKGQLVAENGTLTSRPPAVVYPHWLRHTVELTRGKQAADYRLPASSNAVSVHVIQIFPDQIINRRESARLPVDDGTICTDPQKDVIKLAVVERYGKNGNIGMTFVRGFGLKQGAISSTVSHDHHNLVIAGVDDESMATCARATEEMQGGLVVARGQEVLGRLPLPLGGLFSDEPPKRVIEMLEEINAIAHSLGCMLPAPFMTLSFISLPTVPELGLTDKGLVDVLNHTIIDWKIEE
ncbi:MAG: adenine deaminase [Anaerolineales bacterium]